MKKSIIKNLIALTFALGALVFVAGNVMADPTQPTEPGDQGGGGGTTVTVQCRYNVSISTFASSYYPACSRVL